jgi:hypothetical protein
MAQTTADRSPVVFGRGESRRVMALQSHSQCIQPGNNLGKSVHNSWSKLLQKLGGFHVLQGNVVLIYFKAISDLI